MKKVLAFLFFVSSFLSAHTSQAQCTPADAAFLISANQCLPVSLDGRPSTNEDNHFIEIFEIDNNNNFVGSYYSKWFTGEIGLIDDLNLYTGYQFQLGKKYHIKVAVQNYVNGTTPPFCNPWDEMTSTVTINSGATCYGGNMKLTPWYDFRQECIIGFSAGSDGSFNTADITDHIDRVEFNLNGNVTVDNQFSYFLHMPTYGPFAGNVTATMYYSDGTSSVRSLNYQRCKTVTIDDNPGGPRGRTTGPINNELHAVSIYPNPSAGNMTITNLNSQAGTIKIYNMDGVLVFAKNITSDVEQLQLNKVAKGIYMVHITLDNGKKLIKKQVIQ